MLDAILEHPIWCILGILCLTGIGLAQVVDLRTGEPRLTLDSSTSSLLPDDDEHRRYLDHLGSLFDTGETLLIALVTEDVFTSENLSRIQRISERLEAHRARECELRPLGPRAGGPPILIGTSKPRMLAVTAKYADSWNAYYDDTHNQVDGIRRLRPIIDAACREQGRDPATLERTVTVLMADSTADPWWDRLPSGQTVGQSPLVPLSGTPEAVAEVLREYEREGIAHVQICLEPTTCKTIEGLVPVLEALDAG